MELSEILEEVNEEKKGADLEIRAACIVAVSNLELARAIKEAGGQIKQGLVYIN